MILNFSILSLIQQIFSSPYFESYNALYEGNKMATNNIILILMKFKVSGERYYFKCKIALTSALKKIFRVQ